MSLHGGKAHACMLHLETPAGMLLYGRNQKKQALTFQNRKAQACCPEALMSLVIILAHRECELQLTTHSAIQPQVKTVFFCLRRRYRRSLAWKTTPR